MNISRYQKLFGVGPLGLLIGLAGLSVLWILDRIFRHVAIFSQPKLLRILGFILIAIWICWHSWGVKTILQWWHHDRLCTAGPYRLVRHPIYAGVTFLASLGVSLLFNSWLILLWPVIMYVVYSILVRKEESIMTAVFGEEYRRYASQTGRLFPRLFG